MTQILEKEILRKAGFCVPENIQRSKEGFYTIISTAEQITQERREIEIDGKMTMVIIPRSEQVEQTNYIKVYEELSASDSANFPSFRLIEYEGVKYFIEIK